MSPSAFSLPLHLLASSAYQLQWHACLIDAVASNVDDKFVAAAFGEVTDLPLEAFRSGVFDEGGWSPWFGYGLADTGKALRMAQGAEKHQ